MNYEKHKTWQEGNFDLVLRAVQVPVRAPLKSKTTLKILKGGRYIKVRGEVFITFSRTLISSHHRRYSQVRLAEGGCHAEWGWWLHHVHPGLPQFERYSNFASAGL